jgi:hypothetical protein
MKANKVWKMRETRGVLSLDRNFCGGAGANHQKIRLLRDLRYLIPSEGKDNGIQ